MKQLLIAIFLVTSSVIIGQESKPLQGEMELGVDYSL